MQNLSPACLETTDARIQKAQDIRAQWEDELSSMSVSTEDRMAPRHALRELEKAMPKVSKNKIQNESKTARWDFFKFLKPSSNLFKRWCKSSSLLKELCNQTKLLHHYFQTVLNMFQI